MIKFLLFLAIAAATVISNAELAVPTASISAHVLDISGGSPAGGIQILAFILLNNGWTNIGSQFTQDNGRVDWVSPDFTLIPGTYRLVYITEPYYTAKNVESFYPYVEVVFNIRNATQHYHVPLTLSPWGYSTYRGS
ncbi:putative 5-hydroxyisourate hydrolase ZK697.8 [Caenorhabditis elegans]|uniref:Probable 5-hydroxyisourate hydrolase ZK697.8 n=1 Tax=Caenorhabditis elegans TaxID=6239 RepID=HIUH2_CAEEL|nr:putative 5-hydroxyisourate hydrolase ZK697.8 [Caenorhabditis elegans]O44578.2 RecName: Full=Probable 5-hydroxyisourate hydrolase ZK697.8; Short=HIU hydrolase; Short=HIUHase; AltName: Full=Transthyretin-like protein ZK697.8; Flags: Precursor [Caenorhabditis elegans]CCD74369.1 Probable 5-hydroxyisourate hydrolase ZK697.8 [Caenorhabditis elegans]|eukprot:NP_503496.2 Probable 5-hydroxyisourate hydrolase ZK697.8 [Caenorhabditis elegans]